MSQIKTEFRPETNNTIFFSDQTIYQVEDRSPSTHDKIVDAVSKIHREEYVVTKYLL